MLGRRRGVRVPRGASVWPAAVDATFLKKSSSAGEAKVEQRTRQKIMQGPLRGIGRDARAPPCTLDQAGWTNGHVPLFHPWIEGES